MKKFSELDKCKKHSIIVIVMFSLIVLSLTSAYHVSGDGCWHIPAARFIAENKKFPLFEPLGRDEPFWSPPLYHIFAAAVYGIFNSISHNAADFAVKFVSPVFGIMSLILSFLIINKLFKSKIAFYSAIFLAFVPIFIDYGILSYVESTLTFFVLLSIYFLLEDKVVLSGIAAGLSVLAKYNGLFILPLLIYLIYKKSDNKKIFYKKSITLLFIAIAVSSPWLIRNWILLGNPIWPFLNFVFHGFAPKSYSAANFSYILHPNTIIFTYLGVFGVPDGNYHSISYFNLPYMNILLIVWLAGTLIFFTPLILGIFRIINDRKNKIRKILSMWIIPFILLFLLYIINVGWSVSRIILPAFPAIAVFWAVGFKKFASISKSKLILVLFILVIAGLVSSEIIKFSFAAHEWDKYELDFNWVKSNTNSGSIFIANGQCVPYNIERTSLYATDENIKEADYIWVNQNFNLDKVSIYDDKALSFIKSQNYKIEYRNKNTGTIIYSTKQ